MSRVRRLRGKDSRGHHAVIKFQDPEALLLGI